MSRKIQIKITGTLEYTPSVLDPDWPDVDAILQRDLKTYTDEPLELILHPGSDVKFTGKVIDEPRFLERE